MKWLNATGLLLQFLSFWFAAPEILGDGFLKRMQVGLKSFVTKLSVLVVIVVVLGYGLTFSVMGILKGMNATETPVTNYEMVQYYIAFGLATLLYLIFIFNYKKIRAFIDSRLAGPLIEKLILNADLRKNALITGAILFTLGFLAQFMAILLF